VIKGLSFFKRFELEYSNGCFWSGHENISRGLHIVKLYPWMMFLIDF